MREWVRLAQRERLPLPLQRNDAILGHIDPMSSKNDWVESLISAGGYEDIDFCTNPNKYVRYDCSTIDVCKIVARSQRCEYGC